MTLCQLFLAPMEAFCFCSPRQRDLSCSNSPHGPQYPLSKRRREEDIDSTILKSLLESREKRDLREKAKEMGKKKILMSIMAQKIAETLHLDKGIWQKLKFIRYSLKLNFPEKSSHLSCLTHRVSPHPQIPPYSPFNSANLIIDI